MAKRWQGGGGTRDYDDGDSALPEWRDVKGLAAVG